MLGSLARAKVVRTIGEKGEDGIAYPFNIGQLYNHPEGELAFILGIDHPVKNFDGMIIGKMQSVTDADKHYWILAPRSRKFLINLDIIRELRLDEFFADYELSCIYEHSAGAVTYTFIKGIPHFLLIKNKNSVNWGFPKGHMEEGETKIQTARREVFEETGIKIRLHDGFERTSSYLANRDVRKIVSLFVGFSQNDRVILQTEELCDYTWLPYTEAKHALTFRNDRKVLAHARQFLIKEGIIEVLEDEYSLRKIEKGHGRKKKKASAPKKQEEQTAEDKQSEATEAQEAVKSTETAEAAEPVKTAEQTEAAKPAEEKDFGKAEEPSAEAPQNDLTEEAEAVDTPAETKVKTAENTAAEENTNAQGAD